MNFRELLNESISDELWDIEIYQGLDKEKWFKRSLKGWMGKHEYFSKDEVKITDNTFQIHKKIPISWLREDYDPDSNKGIQIMGDSRTTYARILDAFIDNLGFMYNTRIDIGTKLSEKKELKNTDLEKLSKRARSKIIYTKKNYSLVVGKEVGGYVDISFKFELLK